MINKLKIEIIKNTLERKERNIFESLCKLDTELSLKDKKNKSIELAKLDIVKTHHVGNLFKDEVLRDAFLSEDELYTLNKGFKLIEEFELCNRIIKENNYKILCSPELLKDFLFNCKDLMQVNKTILTLEKELKNLNSEMIKQSLELVDKSNHQVSISKLDSSQKESLANLGLVSDDNDDIITLQKLKKLYYDKLYGLNTEARDVHELSEDFFNIKKAFKAS